MAASPVDLAEELKVCNVELMVVVVHAVLKGHAVRTRVCALAQCMQVAICKAHRQPSLSVMIELPTLSSNSFECPRIAVRAEESADKAFRFCMLLQGS